jgi:membrane fusion protein (multidrug efflux system)
MTPAIGSLQARQRTKIGPEVSGRVAEVLVDEGDAVEKGQLLARIDTTFFEIDVAQSRTAIEAAQARIASTRKGIETAAANVEIARAVLAEAALHYTRMRNLWKKPEGQKPSIPQRLYDDAVLKHRQAKAQLAAAESRLVEAKTGLMAAEAGLRQAEVSLRRAEESLRETEIRAPYEGVITKRFVDPGERVTSTPVSHLLEVEEVGTLELDFSLPQEMLSKVSRGTPVEFRVEGVAGEEIPGEVAVVLPRVDEATRAVRCRVLVDNPERRLRPGLLAQVRVVDEQVADALLVPRRALTRTAAGWEVWVSNARHPVRRQVRIGLIGDEAAQVLEGLEEGDEVLLPAGSGPTEGEPR